MATRKHTYTRDSQCNHASVGLAQARPNNVILTGSMSSDTNYVISAKHLYKFSFMWPDELVHDCQNNIGSDHTVQLTMVVLHEWNHL